MPLVQTTVYLTSGSGSWIVPQNCVSIDAIHAVGGGAGGARYGSMDPGLGGGGGAYARDVPPVVTPGATCYFSIGAAGAGAVNYNYLGGNAGDTWLRWDGTNSPPTVQGQGVLADGGYGGEAYLWYYRAYGGKAENSIGAVKYSGGEGGQPGTSDGFRAGGGGGGAAGCPDGPGGKGGSGSANGISSDGGGGGGVYGNGGLPTGGAAKSGATAGLNQNGASGADGGGGGGGGEGRVDANGRPGASGGTYLIGTSYGPGGGGGGGGAGRQADGGNGGSATSSAWGSGGGGCGGAYGTDRVNGRGGNGRPGGIAITYTFNSEDPPATSFPGAVIPFL